MPRQAHGRSVLASKPAKPTKRKATRNRQLNALEIAEEENPQHTKVPRHRLGHVDDDDDNEDNYGGDDHDGPTSKRQKTNAASAIDSDDTGSDLEGNRWHVGVDDEDEDSDIDSDDAFGESDEEKFADFTFRGTSSKPSKQKRRPVKNSSFLDEDENGQSQGEESEEDDTDDDLGDDAVDLATAWDMDDEDEKNSSLRKRSTQKDTISDDDDDSQEGDEEEAGDDESDNESQLSVSDEEGDHSKLQSFVEGLLETTDTTLHKPDRTRKSLPDKPSQFGLGGSKLTPADLLQYVKDPRQRQTLKMLQNSEAQGMEAYKRGIPGKLAPPLAKRQQDRLDRSAAYEETKKELDKWIDTVKQNRRAEHISFPLNDQSAAATVNSKSLASTSQSQPMTSLESTIQAIMEEQGLAVSTDNQEQEFEELQEKQLPLQEVQARRAELRKERDLLFREEIRARRVKKIKSKAYRRIHRKEREKAGLENRSTLAELGMIDSEEERERNDRRRAEERMGERHRESKWAKSVKATGRGAWDDEARNAVGDLARRDEELRRRIEGKTGDASGSSDDDDLTDSEGLSDSDEERDHLRNKFSQLESEAPDTTETRLSSMAFMKKAEAARRAANDEEIRNAQRMLGRGDAEDSYGSDHENTKSTGRQKYGSKPAAETILPRPTVQRSEFEERASEDEELTGFDHETKHEATSTAPMDKKSRVPAKKAIASMPPVSQPNQARQTSQTNGETAIVSKIEKTPKFQEQSMGKQMVKTAKVKEVDMDGYTSSSGSEGEGDGHSTLAQAIFAGPDEVSEDFGKEKKQIVEEEGDQVIDNTLPGWGSWAGEGTSKKAQKRAKGKFMTTIKGVAADKRKDAKLERVIINEKRVKKNDKYLANELPHPFETRQQYERSLRLPLGPEWTTKNTFQDAIKPRVLMKQGVIRAMARPQA